VTARRAAALLLAALAASCGGPDAPAEVRVFAASSVTDVIQTIAADFEQSTGAKVKLNLASSSVLAKQIVEGAPCDVFLSADPEWADFVERAGLVEPGTRNDLLTNALELVAREDRLVPAVYLSDLPLDRHVDRLLRQSTGRIAMGDPSHVPAGRYAKAALVGMGLWSGVEPRVVPCDSVRAALALAERGEVPMAIVYATDATASDRVQVRERFPSVPGVDIRYPVVGVKGLGAQGRSFLEFLRKDGALLVFRRAGFGLCISPPK